MDSDFLARLLRDFHLPAIGAALIGIVYFRADAPGQTVARRVAASAHGFCIAALYAVAWLVHLAHRAHDSLAVPFTFLMLVPVGFMVMSPLVFCGRRTVHLLLLPLVACLFWVWLRGAVVISGFLF